MITLFLLIHTGNEWPYFPVYSIPPFPHSPSPPTLPLFFLLLPPTSTHPSPAPPPSLPAPITLPPPPSFHPPSCLSPTLLPTILHPHSLLPLLPLSPTPSPTSLPSTWPFLVPTPLHSLPSTTAVVFLSRTTCTSLRPMGPLSLCWEMTDTRWLSGTSVSYTHSSCHCNVAHSPTIRTTNVVHVWV